MRRTTRWVLAATLALGMAASFLVVRSYLRVQEIRRMVELGNGLMALDAPWNDDIRQALRLPSYVYSRSEAVKYYACSVADEHPELLAQQFYSVARFFLPEDCEQAEHYLALYLEQEAAPNPVAVELLRRVREEGCGSASEWLIAKESTAASK